MKKRAVTKTNSRQSRMIARRKRNRLPAVSRKRTSRVSAGRARARTGRRRRTGEAARKLRSSSRGRTRGSARSTTDHDDIRKWVESRGGHPATVKRTMRGRRETGILRIDFPGFSGEESLKPISWDRWFEVFDERNLVFLYRNKRPGRFSKVVRRKK